MIKEAAVLGLPINFQDICLVYPPKNKDISLIGFNTFMEYVSLLTLTQEDLDDIYIKKNISPTPTPLQYLLMCGDSKEYGEQVKKAFSIFCHCEILPLREKEQLIVGPVAERRIIDNTNFFEFQNAIRTSIGMEEAIKPDPHLHPKIRAMQAKARERDRVKAKQEARKCGYSTMILACCCSDIGITPLNVGELSYAGMNALLKMKNQKNRYDFALSQLLAGADPKKVKPKDWFVDFDKY